MHHSCCDWQASAIVKKVWTSNAAKSGGATIKSLSLAPHVQAKKATHAVVCETLRHLELLKHVERAAGLCTRYPRLAPECALVLLYDLLLGQGVRPHGPAERAILASRDELAAQLPLSRAALQSAAVSGASLRTDEVLASWPRYARVNLLKLTVQEALTWLRSPPKACKAWRHLVSSYPGCLFP